MLALCVRAQKQLADDFADQQAICPYSNPWQSHPSGFSLCFVVKTLATAPQFCELDDVGRVTQAQLCMQTAQRAGVSSICSLCKHELAWAPNATMPLQVV